MVEKIKRKVHESLVKVEDDTLRAIKREVKTYQRPAIISGKVTEACNTLENWEEGITQRVEDWMESKKRELGEPEAHLAYSVGHGLLNKMARDTAKYLESALR